MKETGETSFLAATIVLLLLPASVIVAAGELSPRRHTQHKYELFDEDPMMFHAARAACEFRGGELDLPVLTPAEVHYREGNLRELRNRWYWAPVQREAGEWNWWNGSQVNVSDVDKEDLRTDDVPSNVSCAMWNLDSGYVPSSCEERHNFLCLMNRAAGQGCRLRHHNARQKSKGIKWNETGYQTYNASTHDDMIRHLNENHSLALYEESRENSETCRRRCNKIHFNKSLSYGCWFAQSSSRQLAGQAPYLCVLVLGPSFPAPEMHKVVRLKNTRNWFRTCLRITRYKNESCPLECSCAHPDAPITMEEAVARSQKIKAELTLPAANLSAAIRRKASAADARRSAQAVGVVGVSVISCMLVLVVILDMSSLVRDFHKLMANLKGLAGEEG